MCSEEMIYRDLLFRLWQIEQELQMMEECPEDLKWEEEIYIQL